MALSQFSRRLFGFLLLLGTFLQSQVAPYGAPAWPIPDSLPTQTLKTLAAQSPVALNTNGAISQYNDKRLIQMRLILPDSSGFRLLLSAASLTEGDRIFIRFTQSSGFLGPYTREQFSAGGTLMTEVIFESDIVIEWVQPSTEPRQGDVFIQGLAAYRPVSVKSRPAEQIQPVRRSRVNPVILVTGYWPPTNEMIRQFSQNPDLNPDGWMGDDWEGRGYDIVSFFPVFDIPDCDDCGQGNGDLEVDYQDTSSDFWNIVADLQPIAIITFSRGWIDHSWELEWNLVNRTNWIYDYTPPNQPTPNPPDQDHPAYLVRNPDLPLEAIVSAVNTAGLGLNSYVDWEGTAGMFLSEFMGYHGVWYRGENPYGEFPCLAAGHIHVGGQIDWDTARTAAEITLRQLTDYLDQFIYTPGDTNDDGVINVQDLVIIVNYILGLADPDTVQFYAADINTDSIINVLDIIIILNLIIGE
ncbi:MAG: hypothetical protein GXO91_10080 [FCB group bacterium]|nr:hypothetical protein [FCB group bacterium]